VIVVVIGGSVIGGEVYEDGQCLQSTLRKDCVKASAQGWCHCGGS